jgi:protein subunit release factor B
MKELLFSITKKDFEIQTFCSGGKGGQHQNKTESGVRIIHKDSGARGEARDSRYQLQNKKAAFHRLIDSPKFQVWLKIKLAKCSSSLDDVNKDVDNQMAAKNLKVEIQKDGNWLDY